MELVLKSLGRSIETGSPELSQDFNKINEMLAKHPGEYAQASERLADVEILIDDARAELAKVEAELDAKIRPTLSKTASETQVRRQISLDPKVIDLEGKMRDLRHDQLRLQTLLREYENRKVHLLELSRNLRAQYFNAKELTI